MSNNLGDAASYSVRNAVTANSDAVVAAATGLRLMGFSCRESNGGAVATFTIQHSATGAAGNIVVAVELLANSSLTQWFGPQGIDVATNGLSINHIAGEFDVTLYYLTTNPGA